MGWLGVFESILFLLIVYVLLDYKNHEPVTVQLRELAPPLSSPNIVRALLLNPTMYAGFLMCMTISWLICVLKVLTPQYLALDAPVGRGFGAIVSGRLMLVLQIGTVLGGLVAGVVIDKVFKGNPKPVLLLGFLLTAVSAYGIVFPWTYEHPPALLVSLFLAGLAVAFLNPAVAAYMARAYPGSVVGRVAGLWLGIGAFGGALGIFVSAFVLQRAGSFHDAMLAFIVTSMVGLTLSQVLKTSCADVLPGGRERADTLTIKA